MTSKQTQVLRTEEALKRIATYPFSRAEELSVEQMREIARAIEADHGIKE